MDYNLTATVKEFLTLSHVKDDNHVVDVTATIPDGSFIAITENSLPAEGDTRTVNAQIMAFKEGAGGTVTVSTNPFVRGADEKFAMVTLYDSAGKQVQQVRQNYGI